VKGDGRISAVILAMKSLSICCLCFVLAVADQAGAVEIETIPSSANRPVRLSWPSDRPRGPVAKSMLPDGYALSLAAEAPLVTHPIMGCFDDRGRLFVGDAVGVNWNKAQLEANPPNRILLLEDADGDGFYDKSTVFADRLTFPQGAQWLDGSLYVGSPPGIWKFTDRDGDGVAEERSMIVSGFDYTGNAADVHGPFLHPNGRLYWCHGRKGYRVLDGAGRVLHEGASSGVWSANPDGKDVQWHSLLAGDNPVEVDFTPEGDVIGVQNLYYSQPRGDTLVHWLYGGVYERADQLKVIAGLPRTLAEMPVVYNFGHVAVSGCCFWKSYPGGENLTFLVTHFNTQRLVRVDLTPEGSSFRARENEFLKLEDPDVHFTDVIEDRDGSLLVLNTGGWFRIGCPSSLMAKPDVMGSIYRIRPAMPFAGKNGSRWADGYEAEPTSPEALLAGLSASDPHVRRRTLEACARGAEAHAAIDARLLAMMSEPSDAPLEHALLFAAKKRGLVSSESVLLQADSALALRRLLQAAGPDGPGAGGVALSKLDSPDPELARVAMVTVTGGAETAEKAVPLLRTWLRGPAEVSASQLDAIRAYGVALPDQEAVRGLITEMLGHRSPLVRRAALELIASRKVGEAPEEWVAVLMAGLDAPEGPSALLLEALRKVRSPQFDAKLQAIADDLARPAAWRLKALDAVSSRQMTASIFDLLVSTTLKDPSPAARIQAATMLGKSGLSGEQLVDLAPVFAVVGPIELEELLPLIRGIKEGAVARTLTEELVKNPALASQQESVYRTLFSGQAPELFERMVLPAMRTAEAATDAKKRLLDPMAQKGATLGNAEAGYAALAAGKGACLACHRIGELGRPIGPDLSKIGAIRTARDLVESILFPSNTLARDYEAHLIETSDGQMLTGLIRGHTAEGLLLVDAAGQERNLPHQTIVSNTLLPVSLMPMGLDATLSEQELIDVIAYLCSLQ